MDRTKSLLTLVEGRMRQSTCPFPCSDRPVDRAVLHHLEAGGGRIRALMCLHASLSLALSDETSVILATACELLHNASLLQDDVFDREATRRGVASVWQEYGETVAICAGDLVLSSAFSTLADLREITHIAPAIHLAFRHARTVIVSQGTELNASPTTLAEYEALALGKSSSLLTLPLHLPLSMSGHQASMPLAQRVTDSFAAAYQIADDLEDYAQDRSVGALNVVSILTDIAGLDLDHAHAVATCRAIELLHNCIHDATSLPGDCAAVMLQHACTMLQKLEVDALTGDLHSRSLHYVG